MQNRYHIHLGCELKGELVDVLCVEYPAPTHYLATKAVEVEYPDLVVTKVTQCWYPIGNCARCGGTIFSGDYQKDQIEQRNGKNRCLDCV